MVALWDNCTACPHGCTHSYRCPRQSLTARRGMSPWPNLFKSSLRGPASFCRQETEVISHPNLSLLPASLLLVFPLFVPPRVLPVLGISLCCLSVCRPHTAANTMVEAWACAWCHPLAEQRCCQGPTTVGLWSCSDPGRAGWQQAEGGQDLHSLASTSNRDVETTTSDAWQEKKKRAECRISPSPDSI